ncbi:MAG TPA: hypothetical protein VFC81_02060, partial [Verrucomicrobiae bacterium]|nr:hypothetical protein [Verrucomicrobiae bacterium]
MAVYSVTVRVRVAAEVSPGRSWTQALGLGCMVKLRSNPGTPSSAPPLTRSARPIFVFEDVADPLCVTMNVVGPAGKWSDLGSQPARQMRRRRPTDHSAAGGGICQERESAPRAPA